MGSWSCDRYIKLMVVGTGMEKEMSLTVIKGMSSMKENGVR